MPGFTKKEKKNKSPFGRKRKKEFFFFFNTFNKEMLLSTLLTKYGWLIANVPEILHSCYRWKSWLEGLSPLDVMNLKMNVSGFRHHRRLIEGEFDSHEPEIEEFDCLVEIHRRLVVELSLRLTS